MQSDHAHYSGTNGAVDGEESYANGYEDFNGYAQNGVSHIAKKRKKRISQIAPQEKDIICLIGQHLREKGYSNTLDTLIEESGCILEHPKAAHFRRFVSLGHWKEALDSLNDLSTLLKDPSSVEKMRLLILEEKFLELLESGDRLSALQCLRHDLSSLPLHHPDKRIQDLSQYVMCQSKEELHRLANWPGAKGGARDRLMDQLQAFLPSSIMLPPKRLETLLKQSLQLQIDKCPFHYTDYDTSTCSLFSDHICSRNSFPCEVVHTLRDHADEVWYVKFSHDGSRLASGSKDGSIIIWTITGSGPPTRQCTLQGQSSGITCIDWSPDDTMLLVCGSEDCSEVIIFDMVKCEEKCRVNNSSEDSLTCGAWDYTGQRFYVGGLRGQFFECSPEDGSVINKWEGVRLYAMATHPSSSVVFAADSHMRVKKYDFQEKTSETILKEDHPIMSITIASDGRHAILNVASQGVHMWDIVDRCLVRRYQGVTQGFYTIHSCFGVSNSFIASGSEDHQVYIWNQRRETPIVVLQGHTHTVNCVCWNPKYHSMIASASDDCTISIWGTEEEMKQQKELRQLLNMETNKKDIEEMGVVYQNGAGEDSNLGSDNDNTERSQQLPISEADLQALEILEPESSSQEGSSGSADRLEAAVSLSSLSDPSRPQYESTRMSGSSTVLVIMPAPSSTHSPTSVSIEREDEDNMPVSDVVPPLLRSSLEEQDSRSFELDSSIESEGSRQLESLVMESGDTPGGEGVSVITSAVRTSGQSARTSGNDPLHYSSTDTSNGASNNDSSRNGSNREDDTSQRPRITGSSISTMV